MNLSTIASTHAADPQIGFLTKSILKSYHTTRMVAQRPCRQRGN